MVETNFDTDRKKDGYGMFRTSRSPGSLPPGFYGQGFETGSNVTPASNTTPAPAPVVRPATPLGNANVDNHEDGPSGKQFSGMTDDEIRDALQQGARAGRLMDNPAYDIGKGAPFVGSFLTGAEAANRLSLRGAADEAAKRGITATPEVVQRALEPIGPWSGGDPTTVNVATQLGNKYTVSKGGGVVTGPDGKPVTTLTPQEYTLRSERRLRREQPQEGDGGGDNGSGGFETGGQSTMGQSSTGGPAGPQSVGPGSPSQSGAPSLTDTLNNLGLGDVAQEVNNRSESNGGGGSSGDTGGFESGEQAASDFSSGADVGLHTGGPVVGPDPAMQGEEFQTKVLEGEHMMDQQSASFWGEEVLSAMQAIASGEATPEDIEQFMAEVNMKAQSAQTLIPPNGAGPNPGPTGAVGASPTQTGPAMRTFPGPPPGQPGMMAPKTQLGRMR